jgi:hypothetical protein
MFVLLALPQLVPPHPVETLPTAIPVPRLIVAPDATPFAVVLATTKVGVLELFGAADVGISQPTKISAKAEDEIHSEIAQKQDKNRILPFTIYRSYPRFLILQVVNLRAIATNICISH